MGKPINLKEPPEAPVLSEEDFHKFARERQVIADKAGTASADIKALYKKFTGLGLHEEAFKLADKLSKMEAGKCADFLRALDKYRAFKNLDAQGDVFDGKLAAAE